MKHGVKTRKFGRTKKKREAFMRSLARSLILEERITTTEARAKSLRPYVEKLVTKARDASVATRRSISSKFGNDAEVTRKLCDVLAPRFADRPGGYTRIVKLPPRKSDASPMAIIEFVEKEDKKEESK